MIDRNEFIEEQLLRENIRKAIKIIREKKEKQAINEEDTLRSVVRKMLIMEKAAVSDEVPHEKTGINYLKKTLKKIIGTIKDDYGALTTSKTQRDSYKAHLVNGVDNLLVPIETNIDAPLGSDENNAGLGALGEGDLDEEIEINVGEEGIFDNPEDVGLPADIPEEPEEPEDEDLAKLTTGSGLPEDDEDARTGLNAALGTFKQIQGNIVDDFGKLANDEDRELYHDYLKTNLLLWIDKFEDDLSLNLPNPTTPEYEEEKSQEAASDAPDPLMEAAGDVVLDLSQLL